MSDRGGGRERVLRLETTEMRKYRETRVGRKGSAKNEGRSGSMVGII